MAAIALIAGAKARAAMPTVRQSGARLRRAAGFREGRENTEKQPENSRNAHSKVQPVTAG
jgi:hypothetical protein